MASLPIWNSRLELDSRFAINISFSPILRKPNELFTSIAKLRRDDS